MTVIRFKRKFIGFILCCIGIFLLPYILRDRFIPEISSINIVFYLGLFLVFSNKLVLSPIYKKNSPIKKYIYIIFILLSSFLLFYVRGNGWSTIMKFKMIFVYVLPSTLIFMTVADEYDFLNITEYWYKCIKLICYSMIIAWAFDKVAGGVLQKFWIYLYRTDSLASMYNSGRFISYYGHSLLNASFMLSFLLWTLIRRKESISSKQYLMNIIVSFFGIAISGSKSALLMATLMLFVFITELKNLKYILPLFGGFILLYNTGIFDIVLERLFTSIEAGDLTTSRNTALIRLLETRVIVFNLFKGHSIDYSGTSMIAALEYPILRWAYRNGIVFSLVMYFVYFLLPIVLICTRKKWKILFGVLAYMAYMNGYDGISGFSDTLLIYSMNIALIVLLCGIKDKLKKSFEEDKYGTVNSKKIKLII